MRSAVTRAMGAVCAPATLNSCVRLTMGAALGAALGLGLNLSLSVPASAQQVSAQGVDEVLLRNGQWTWIEDAALVPVGGAAQRAAGVTLLVSLPGQVAYVYRDGVLIAASTVSTGKRGKGTPTGAFSILQKRVHHRSNLYSNAPMPFMQRLTWDGIALHAGTLPGYPASHGCIRFPRAFAERLYGITELGTSVVVVDYEIVDPRVRRGVPGLRAEQMAQVAPQMPTPIPRSRAPYLSADFAVFETGDYDRVTMRHAVSLSGSETDLTPDGGAVSPVQRVRRGARQR